MGETPLPPPVFFGNDIKAKGLAKLWHKDMKLKALQVKVGDAMVRQRRMPIQKPCWMNIPNYRFSQRNILYT